MQTCTYVWINENEEFEEKSYTFNEIKQNNEIPNWYFHITSTLVKPQFVCPDPFIPSINKSHKLVFCDLYYVNNDVYPKEEILYDNNSRYEMIEYLKKRNSFSIIQKYELNQISILSFDFNHYCQYAQLPINYKEENPFCYNINSNIHNIYEHYWMSRYILNRLASIQNILIHFYNLEVVNSEDELLECFNSFNI